MQRKIGISCLCYGLFPLFRGPEHILSLAQKDGIDGLQLLPIWFWSKEGLEKLPQENIFSYEDAWNGGRFLNIYRDSTFPKSYYFMGPFYNIGLFMGIWNISVHKRNQLQRLFPSAPAVDTMLPGDLRETQAYGDHAWRNSGPIVLDSYHLLEYTTFDEEEALRVAREVATRAKLIHFQIRAQKETCGMLADFFAGKGYLHEYLKIATQEAPHTPIIIEVLRWQLPRLSKPSEKVFSLIDIANQLRNY